MIRGRPPHHGRFSKTTSKRQTNTLFDSQKSIRPVWVCDFLLTSHLIASGIVSTPVGSAMLRFVFFYSNSIPSGLFAVPLIARRNHLKFKIKHSSRQPT